MIAGLFPFRPTSKPYKRICAHLIHAAGDRTQVVFEEIRVGIERLFAGQSVRGPNIADSSIRLKDAPLSG